MAKFLRHVGKVGDRKVAVIFREIPGESHMSLIVYTELLNRNIHDPLISAIESPQGQAAKDLADALNRAYTMDGKVILQVLHSEGMMKKMQTNQIVMTPTPGTTIRLNELNQMLDEMDKGEAAVRRMAEMDASRGLQDPADVARRMRGENTVNAAPLMAGSDATLADDGIAQNLRNQAARMAAEARGLMAEATRLEQEAASLTPAPVINTTDTAKKKAGRPKKAVVAG